MICWEVVPIAISYREVDGIQVTNGCGNVTNDDLLSLVTFFSLHFRKDRLLGNIKIDYEQSFSSRLRLLNEIQINRLPTVIKL